MNLSGAILDALAEPRCRLTYGVVAAVSPLTVIVGPSTVAARATAIDSYVPVVGDYVPILIQGADRIVLGAIDASPVTAWTAVTFANGWANYGGSEQVAQLRKVGDEVQLRGVIKSGTVNFVDAISLPVGFRPPANQPIATLSNGAHAELYVTAAGGVQVIVGSNASVSLTISFSTSP